VVLRKGVAGNEPVFGAAFHSNRAPGLIVENFIPGNGNSRRAMKYDARVGDHRVGAVDDVPADYDIAVPGLPDNRRAFALLDNIACDRVSRGAGRVQVNSYAEASLDRPDAGYHVSGYRRAGGSGVELGIAPALKDQDTLTNCLQHGTSDYGRIGAAHLKADDFLVRRHATDCCAAHIAYVFCRIVRIEMRGVRDHPGPIGNYDVALNPAVQASTRASRSYRMASMRKTTCRDADILRGRTDHDPVMDVMWRLSVTNMVDVAIRDAGVAHR